MADTKKILIVDDGEIIWRVIQNIADRYGVDSTVVSNGKDAETLIQSEEQCDAVFLDLLIPFKSGWDIIKSIKENLHRNGTPIVVLTGAPINLEEKRKLGEQVTAVIDKGTFNLELFEQLFEDLLRK